MRFICTELGGEAVDLFAVSREEADSLTDEGATLTQMMTLGQNKQGIDRYAYYFGGDLTAASGRFALNGTARTIAEIESDLSVDIDLNFSDSATYRTTFHKLSEISTNLWFTLLTDAGLGFYLPTRVSTSRECQNYAIVARTKRSGIFESVNYAGESGAEIYITLDERSGFLPATVDDTQKARVVNKFYSLNGRATIQTTEELNPLDYITENGEVYLVMNRKPVANAFQYECVREVTDARSFSAADVVPYDAISAMNAYNSAEATHATSADTATSSTNATHATSADTATTADALNFDSNAFSATKTGSQSISAGSFTRVTFAEDYDIDSTYNSSYRWTPGDAGYYHVEFSLYMIGSDYNAADFRAVLYKNGAAYRTLRHQGNTYAQNFAFSADLQLKSTDYLEVYVYCSKSGVSVGANAMFSGRRWK